MGRARNFYDRCVGRRRGKEGDGRRDRCRSTAADAGAAMVAAFLGTTAVRLVMTSHFVLPGNVLITLLLIKRLPAGHVVMAKHHALRRVDRGGTLERYRERNREDEEQPCDSRHG